MSTPSEIADGMYMEILSRGVLREDENFVRDDEVLALPDLDHSVRQHVCARVNPCEPCRIEVQRAVLAWAGLDPERHRVSRAFSRGGWYVFSARRRDAA